MASSAKRPRSSQMFDADDVIDMLFDEDSDNEGMSSGEESDLDRQLLNESEESR